jgi:putative Ca2+/H+ antiporter (TMEM165/GDT1 family)
VLKDILIGVAIAAATGTGAVVCRWAIVTARVPKRTTRLEAAIPMLILGQVATFDALLVLAECAGANGKLASLRETIRESRAEMMAYLSGAAISQKGKQ